MPTHYHIVVNDLVDRKLASSEELRKQIATLSYKMCYLYYNTVGAIKVPVSYLLVKKFVGSDSLCA